MKTKKNIEKLPYPMIMSSSIKEALALSKKNFYILIKMAN